MGSRQSRKAGSSQATIGSWQKGSMQAVLKEAKERYPGYSDTIAIAKYREQLEKIASYASSREMRVKAMEKFTLACYLLYIFYGLRN